MFVLLLDFLLVVLLVFVEFCLLVVLLVCAVVVIFVEFVLLEVMLYTFFFSHSLIAVSTSSFLVWFG